ncbi:MAG: PIG-L family deacetylase [Anaerolineae bacterium]|jgi:LmbE family N-acetylglucosaminyl deacetylase|nr:PIG-L family deacetylase [Anaerolineae bacterium]
MKSVVGFFAHPDDETVLAGGLTAMLIQQNIPVHLVCATRGEGGETGPSVLMLRRETLGAAREAELRCAAMALGASVEVLNYIDPTIGQDEVLRAFEVSLDTLARQFAAILHERRADLVLTHGTDGEYGHPAHQLVHRAVIAAVKQYFPRALVYSVAARVPTIEDDLWNQNQIAHFALDIRPWAAQKIAAMECHASQHELFLRKSNQNTVSETLRVVESVRRMWPVSDDEPPQDAFANLLRLIGAWSPES